MEGVVLDRDVEPPIAGVFEVAWAIGLKYTNGFSRLWTSVGALAALASVVLLAGAMKELPVGTAYAVWTGVGAIGTARLGIYLFGDSGVPGAAGLPGDDRGGQLRPSLVSSSM